MSWFNDYGWNFNPFDVRSNTNLIGLKKQESILLDFASSGDVCFVTGESGSGKTSLLKWLQKSLEGHKVVYLSAENLDEFFNLKRFIQKRAFLRSNKVLLVDEAHYSDISLKNQMKMLWDEGYLKSMVIAQTRANLDDYRDSFKKRMGDRHIRLKGMDFDWAKEMISLRTNSSHPFSDEVIEYIVEASNYVPRKILEGCELVCMSLRGKEINVDNVKKVLNEKKIESLMHLEKLEEPTLPNSLMPMDNLNLRGFSPMQKRLIKIMLEGSRTACQLAKIMNTSEGSIGKQLSKLMDKSAVAITDHRRPKVYGLREDFKKSLTGKG